MPDRYTVGDNKGLQLVQFVSIVLQVAHGELQAVQIEFIGILPVAQLVTHVLSDDS